jgi:hypothetical protein
MYEKMIVDSILQLVEPQVATASEIIEHDWTEAQLEHLESVAISASVSPNAEIRGKAEALLAKIDEVRDAQR